VGSRHVHDGRRIRVSLVVESTVFGGAEVYVAHLLRGLPDRFERTLVAAQPVPRQLAAAAQATGARIVEMEPVRNKFDLARLARAARSVRSTTPDLVHLNLPVVTSNRHLLAALTVMRMPVVATLHLALELENPLQVRLLRPFYQRLSRLIAVSEGTRRQLCSELRVPESAVEVVRHGIPRREPVVLRDGQPVRIGGVGRITVQKGFDILVDAVRGLAEAGYEIDAVIAGDGPDLPLLQRQASGLPISFLGFVDDIQAFLDSLDIFCLSSRWEAFPFALLEAMMAGLPCVAADVGDVKEALGPAGLLVPREDADALGRALRELIDDYERRRALGESAHARALARHSTEPMIERTAHVYDDILRLSPRRP
jgi:glycosyltransferase involved in cell wall biosynthesis